MADMISRAAAIEAAIDGADDWDGGYNPNREQYIRQHMGNVPTVDAVPIVRCKDCIYYDKEPGGDVMMCYCGLGWTSPDDYCSKGERREEDG